MTLVPSWQQLANPANAAEANLLQPLFAAAASDADWRRPLIVDSSGGLRLQAEQAAAVFPAVVYERAAVASSSSRGGGTTYNKRSSKASSTATSAVVGPPPAHGPMTNPPPAHSNSYSTSSTVRNGSYHNSTSGNNNQNSSNVKKEPSQLSPVKKRIKETKDHQYELYRQQQHLQQQDHSPGKFFFFSFGSAPQ